MVPVAAPEISIDSPKQLFGWCELWAKYIKPPVSYPPGRLAPQA